MSRINKNIILTILFTIILCSAFLIKSKLNNKSVQQIFPLNQDNGEYILTATSDHFSLTYYKNGQNNSDINSSEVISILIGSSNEDLTMFINQKVHVKGDFYLGIPLCRTTNCSKAINRPVLNIEEIELNQ